MSKRDPRHTIAKLRQLLDELEASLAEQRNPASAADGSDATDAEERYIAERVAQQLAKLRGKTTPGSSRVRKVS